MIDVGIQCSWEVGPALWIMTGRSRFLFGHVDGCTENVGYRNGQKRFVSRQLIFDCTFCDYFISYSHLSSFCVPLCSGRAFDSPLPLPRTPSLAFVVLLPTCFVFSASSIK